MAKDFSEMLNRAREEHQSRVSDHDDAAAREKAGRDAKRENATRFLDQNVRPLLVEAKQQFSAQGIPLEVTDNWSDTPASPSLYAITVFAKGPTRSNQFGGQTTPVSRKAFFQHDGKSLFVGMSQSSYENYPADKKECSPERLEGMLEAYLEQLLSSYYASVEEQRGVR